MIQTHYNGYHRASSPGLNLAHPPIGFQSEEGFQAFEMKLHAVKMKLHSVETELHSVEIELHAVKFGLIGSRIKRKRGASLKHSRVTGHWDLALKV